METTYYLHTSAAGADSSNTGLNLGLSSSANDKLMEEPPPGAWRTRVVGRETVMLVELRVDIVFNEACVGMMMERKNQISREHVFDKNMTF